MMISDNILDSLNYVSRGGQKLAKALDCFAINPQDKVCIDCGASTGGFTDCLLQKGARYVYAIDVGYGQLAWTLRNDPRVKVMERTNIRYVTIDMLDEAPSLAVIDVSFISLALVLPVIKQLLSCAQNNKSEVICLIKPQFEAGKGKVGKGGVVREPEIHEEVLQSFAGNAMSAGFSVQGITYSPVKGPKGNIEYLGYITNTGAGCVNPDDECAAGINFCTIVANAHKELNT